MKVREIVKAKRLLRDHADRFEVCGIEGGGLALTAFWLDGGQRLFYTLVEVEELIRDRLS